VRRESKGCGWPSDGGLRRFLLLLLCRFLPPVNNELVVGRREKGRGEEREREWKGGE